MMRDIAADILKLRGVRRPYAEKALQRLILLSRWLRFRDEAAALGLSVRRASEEGVERLRAEGELVSVRTLHNWRRAYYDAGWRGLIDQRQRDGRTPADPRFLALIRRYHAEGRRPALAHDLAAEKAEQRGWRACTYRETRRYIRSLQQGRAGGVGGR